MRRSKKLIIAAVLAGVLLFGSLGGVALAQGDDGGGLKARFGDFITTVCDKYDEYADTPIDREALQMALDEVRPRMPEGRPEMDPEAIAEHLDALLDEGKITQEQYDRMIERWESMPDDVPKGSGFHGRGGPRGFWGPCAPAE